MTESSNDLESFERGNSIRSDGVRIGAVFSFNQVSVTSRVGISLISSTQACSSVQREIPATSTFIDIVRETKDIWNINVLSKITTTETTLTDLQNLYTSLYIMHQSPSNRTGENPG
jgi:putative alpha-1,2-mannosidase